VDPVVSLSARPDHSKDVRSNTSHYNLTAKVTAMSTVFLSYSKKDYFFAELADIKLSEAGISLWRDQGANRLCVPNTGYVHQIIGPLLI
jgi:hypothetical protein